MIFVHSRKDTVKTSTALLDEASAENKSEFFDCSTDPQYQLAVQQVNKSRNAELRSLFAKGFVLFNKIWNPSRRNAKV